METNMKFVAIRATMEERCPEETNEVRGTYETHEEATRAINAWRIEYGDDEWTTWMHENMCATEEYLINYQIHKL
jgi:hypothetical protein